MVSGPLSCQICGCGSTSCENCAIANECAASATCCCPQTHQSWRLGRISSGVSIEYLSAAWMSIEVVAALVTGILAGSFALLAFSGDSFVELISGLAVLRFLRRSGAVDFESEGKRAERISGLLLFALIPSIGAGSFYSYFTGVRAEGSPLGIAIAAGAIMVMPYLWYQKRRIGRETATQALINDAVESITCILMSIALLGGLLAEFFFRLWWVDYIATAIILTFVAKEALESYHDRHPLQ